MAEKRRFMRAILLGAALLAPGAGGALEIDGIAFAWEGKPSYLKGLEVPGLFLEPSGRQEAVLAAAREAGAPLVLTQAFAFRPAGSAIQTGPESFDVVNLGKVHALAARARKAGVRLLLILMADSSPWGGKADYAVWAGSSNPNVFYFDFRCRDWFRAHVRELLTRKPASGGPPLGKDPAVAGFVLVDSPENTGAGEETAEQVNRWTAEMAAHVRALAPGKKLAVALQARARGVDLPDAAAQPGIDFVLLRPVSGKRQPYPFQLAARVGKPVAAVAPLAWAAAFGKGAAGCLVSAASGDPGAAPERLARLFAVLEATRPAAAGEMFLAVEAASEGGPLLRHGASAVVTVRLAEALPAAVRYGAGASLDRETPWAAAAAFHRIRLEGLTAGAEVAFQVKVRRPDGREVYSDRGRFRTAEVVRRILEPPPPPEGFIGVQGKDFVKDGRPWRYVGGNCYYLHYYPPEAAEYVFSWAGKIGFQVMRVGTFGETDRWEELSPDERRKFFVRGPGDYVEENLRNLDRVIAQAGKHGQRVIFTFSDNWKWFGGAEVWARYFGYKDKNDFYDKDEVKKAFQDHITFLVNRVNTVSGRRYRDDPTIFCWDLLNEARYERDPSGRVLAAWTDEMAAHVKSLGVKQLVTTGSEGHRAEGGAHYTGSDFLSQHRSPHVDFATFHVYPSSEHNRWNWRTTEALLKAYVEDAHEKLGKPVVMEEYGILKNQPAYDRPLWIHRMVEAFHGAGGNGSNYWMLVEPTYQWGDGNEFDPTKVDICNVFALQAEKLKLE